MGKAPAWLVAVCVLLPFAGAALFIVVGRPERTRRMAAVLYAALDIGFVLALLNAYMSRAGKAGLGSLKFTSFSFPAFVILNLLTAALVIYGAFRPTMVARPEILMSSVPAACGLAGLALTVSTILPFVLLWLGVTVVAGLSLVAHGGSSLRLRLLGFAPWLAADALLVIGAVLAAAWLKETPLLISPPVTHGSETQTVIVMVFFLLSALVRLGAFPFTWWIGDLANHTDRTWSSFFIGTVNFILAGTRLVVVVTLIGRIVASDWGLGLALVALASIAAGPVLALRARTSAAFLAGAYCMLTGFLLFALSMYSRIGMEAALIIAWTGVLFNTAFMMATGTASDARGETRLGRQLLPVRAGAGVFLATFLSGMAIAGLPPLDGFVGKGLAVLAGLDKSGVQQFYALAAAICLLASAVAFVAAARLLAGSYTPTTSAHYSRKPTAVEQVLPVAVIAGSVMFGLFPGLLARNFASGASRILFANSFTGPGVVFKGTSEVVERAAALYVNRADVFAALLLAVACIALAGYFLTRSYAAEQGSGGASRPFMGGAPGQYSGSWPGPGHLKPGRRSR